MPEYRVVDARAPEAEPVITNARSPEEAAERALGVRLVRGGQARELRARVYFTHPGQAASMVRLYARAD